MRSLDEVILDVEATHASNGRIRLKYIAVSGGYGPELYLSVALASRTVTVLQEILREPTSKEEAV
jgi:hypothetical protein